MELAEKTAFLGTGRIIPTLLKLGIPAALGLLVNALYNVVDTIYVGHGVGSLAIAALSVAFPLQMLVIAFAMALGAGGASVLSRRLGEGRTEDAAHVVGTVLSAVIVLTAVMTALVLVFIDPVLRIFGATDTILPLARDYMVVIGIGFVFNGLAMALSPLLQAEGNPKASMIGLIIGAILNALLAPVFIFILPWGVTGAALSTLISQTVSFMYLGSVYLRGRSHVRLQPRHFRPQKTILQESSVLGVPTLVQNAGMSVLMIIVNQSLAAYGGDEALTIYGMNFRLMSLAYLPMFGLVQGFQPVAGYNYGAKNYGRVRKALFAAMGLSFAVMAVVWALFQVAPNTAMGLFTSDTGLASRAGAVLSVLSLFLPLVGLQVVGATYFQAVGKAVPSMLLGLSRQFLILIPLLLLLPLVWKLSGIWWAFPLSDLAATAITVVFLVVEVSHLGRRHEEATRAGETAQS